MVNSFVLAFGGGGERAHFVEGLFLRCQCFKCIKVFVSFLGVGSHGSPICATEDPRSSFGREGEMW